MVVGNPLTPFDQITQNKTPTDFTNEHSVNDTIEEESHPEGADSLWQLLKICYSQTFFQNMKKSRFLDILRNLL